MKDLKEMQEKMKQLKNEKRFKKVVFKDEYFIFMIDEKDDKLFNQAKKQCWDDIYFFIENLEFLGVGFDIVKWEEK